VRIMMVKANRLLVVTTAAAMACSSVAFRTYNFVTWPSPTSYVLSKDLTPSLLSSSIFASRKRGVGFGLSTNRDGEKQPKYSVNDKSYGIVKNDNVCNGEDHDLLNDVSSMNEFFTTYVEWEPLFRSIFLGGIGRRDDDTTRAAAMASPILLKSNDSQLSELWGIATLERRNPWRLLPSKPTSETSLQALSAFLDEWQRSLLDIPLDAVVTGDNDLHFLEEGRRTIAVTRFHVLHEHNDDNDKNGALMNANNNNNEGDYDWKTELFRTCWSELAHLTSQDCADTGSLVLIPAMMNGGGGLDVVRDFVERNLIRPIRWLGRDDDWEIVVMERGGLAVRMLYKLSDIPDLERSQKLLE
jgi:hypothetical protein